MTCGTMCPAHNVTAASSAGAGADGEQRQQGCTRGPITTAYSRLVNAGPEQLADPAVVIG
jgi:hypothetical protein